MSEVKRGLAGVVADTTAISKVMAETNSLTYRGYAVEELVEHCRFEEVAYLLWHGELPDEEQLALQLTEERSRREVSGLTAETVQRLSPSAHPMDVLRTAVSILGAEDPTSGDRDPETLLHQSVGLFARLPTIVAAEQRRRRGLDPIAPDPELGFSENLLFMTFGERPAPEVVEAFEVSMVLYAEHSFNASTFAARVVTSTTSDLYSAVVAAIGALKGPLHGGANEAVMEMMLEIGDPERAESWLGERLAAGEKIMGFGHRVYRSGDSRVPTMKAALERLAATTGGQRWLEMYERLERKMLAEKEIHPNVDFPTGPAYYLMGFDIPVFTPLFVVSRITGWTAHIMEQAADNRLIRPLAAYDGPPQRSIHDR